MTTNESARITPAEGYLENCSDQDDLDDMEQNNAAEGGSFQWSGRYGPLTLNTLCSMTNQHTLTLEKQYQEFNLMLRTLQSKALEEFSKMLDLSPARAAACFQEYMIRVNKFLSLSFHEIKRSEEKFGITVFQFSTHAFAQALRQESESLYQLYLKKIENLETMQKKEIDLVREGSKVQTKRALEKHTETILKEREVELHKTAKQQEKFEETYTMKLKEAESELQASQRENEVLKERQRHLLKEATLNESWKKKFEEERDDKMIKEEHYQQSLRRLTFVVEDQQRKHQKEVSKKDRELNKCKAQLSQLKERFSVEKQKCKRLATDTARKQQQQSRSQSDLMRKELKSSPGRRPVKAEEASHVNTRVSFVDRSPRWSCIANRRFSEMAARRPSVMFDKVVQWNEYEDETKQSSVFHKKRASRVIQSGRLSFLSPSNAPHDIESSGEVINGIKANYVSSGDGSFSRHSQILQNLSND